MRKSKKQGQVFFAIMPLYVVILVLLFFIIIISEKEDTQDLYDGGLSKEITKLNNLDFAYKQMYENAPEELYYKKLENELYETFYPCREDFQGSKKPKIIIQDDLHQETMGNTIEDTHACWEEVAYEKDFVEEYNSSLNSYFSSLQKDNEKIITNTQENSSHVKTTIEINKTIESVDFDYENENLNFVYEQSRTFNESLPLIRVKDFTNSNLFDYQAIKQFETELMSCGQNSGKPQTCAEEIGEKYFGIENTDLSVSYSSSSNYYVFEFVYQVEDKFSLPIYMRLDLQG